MNVDAANLFHAFDAALASVTTKTALDSAIARFKASKSAGRSGPQAARLPLYITDALYTDISARLLDIAGGESRNLYEFLESRSFASVLQQATAADLVRGSATLPSLVKVSYRLAVELEKPRGFDVDALFPVVCDAVSRSLAALLPDAQERKRLENGATAILLSSQLESLARLVDLRTSAVDSTRVLEFANRLRPATHEGFRLLTTPHWDSGPRVPIDDVYIRGRFDVPDSARATLPPRMVLLGMPGGGKTTFARHLAFRLSDENVTNHYYGDATPNNVFFVTIREFEQSGCRTLLDFIEEETRTIYSITPPLGAVELLLLGGKAVVILDGLDELLDTTKRRRMVDIVEGFARSYPNAPVFVTSRRVGYDEAPLADVLFYRSDLQGFGEDEVRDYVGRWFATHPDLGESEAPRRAAQFLRTSTTVEDLRRNPLLLALLCNLYKATEYQDLPRTRASIYEKCALTLYDRWDRHRNIGKVDFERDFLPTISAVASRIYGDGELEQGISKPRLITVCVDFLFPLKYGKRSDAEAFARDLVNHCTGRAWVLMDVGVNGRGDDLYQFAHRTFLEFFSAAHLVRTHADGASLAHALDIELIRSATIVPDLAFELKARQLDAGAERFLEVIMQRASNEQADRGALLAFAARSLLNVPIADQTIREVVVAVSAAVDGGGGNRSSITDLCGALPENMRAIAVGLRNYLGTRRFSDTSTGRGLVWQDLRGQARVLADFDAEGASFWRG